MEVTRDVISTTVKASAASESEMQSPNTRGVILVVPIGVLASLFTGSSMSRNRTSHCVAWILPSKLSYFSPTRPHHSSTLHLTLSSDLLQHPLQSWSWMPYISNCPAASKVTSLSICAPGTPDPSGQGIFCGSAAAVELAVPEIRLNLTKLSWLDPNALLPS